MDSGSGNAAANPVEPKEKIPILPYPLDGFLQIWTAYPRKVDRFEGEKAYDELAADPPVAFEALLKAVILYRDRKPECNDTAYLATWLRRRRWNDEWPDPPPIKPRFIRDRKPWQPRGVSFQSRGPDRPRL